MHIPKICLCFICVSICLSVLFIFVRFSIHVVAIIFAVGCTLLLLQMLMTSFSQRPQYTSYLYPHPPLPQKVEFSLSRVYDLPL